jgi:catechol 2,3-dioxygenase
MATDPLDIDGVIDELANDDGQGGGLAPRTTIGHVHLHVADLRAAEAFYCGVLGFEAVASMPSALFISAGGYHHHIGLNTWAGVGAPPPPEGSAGLRHFAVELPDQAALDQVLARLHDAGVPAEQVEAGWLARDPSLNGVVLAARTRY